MKERCFEIGAIQAFLDGELAPEISENVANHVSDCADCSILLAEAEEESAFAFAALDQEFNTLVPTQRLWTKINDSIESERKSIWQNVFAFVSDFKSNLSNQTIVAFASLLIIVGLFASALILRNEDDTLLTRQDAPPAQKAGSPILSSETAANINNDAETFPAVRKSEGNSGFVVSRNDKNEFRAVKVKFVNRENNKLSSKTNLESAKTKNRKLLPEVAPRATDENLAGEDSYVKTIAALTETVNNRKDEVLKPSARFAFEKDLAVVSDAIVKMKTEVRKNPKNEGAKQVLLASYQNKIDLLNSVTEKTELMASLK